MHSLLDEISLLLLACVLVFSLAGCEEAITNNNNAGIPNTGSDSLGTSFIEFTTASETVPIVGVDRVTSTKAGLSDVVSLEVEPNFAVTAEIAYEYEVAGVSAAQGRDYRIPNPSPDTIPYNAGQRSLDSDSIYVLGVGAEPGGAVTLTDSSRVLQVGLTSAETIDGSQTVEVGRGGESVGTTRLVSVSPTIRLALTDYTFLSEVPVPVTDSAATDSVTTLIYNNSTVPFDVTNVEITGPDAGEFSVQPMVRTSQDPIEVSPTSIQTVPGDSSMYAKVYFSPQSTGEKTATLSFDVSNSANMATASYEMVGTAVSASE